MDGWHISAAKSCSGIKVGWIWSVFLLSAILSKQTSGSLAYVWELKKSQLQAVYILKSIWQLRWNIPAEDNWLILTEVTALKIIIHDLECRFEGIIKKNSPFYSCWIDWKNLASLSVALVDTPRDWNPGCPWTRLRKQTLKFSPHHVQPSQNSFTL